MWFDIQFFIFFYLSAVVCHEVCRKMPSPFEIPFSGRREFPSGATIVYFVSWSVFGKENSGLFFQSVCLTLSPVVGIADAGKLEITDFTAGGGIEKAEIFKRYISL